MSDGLKLISAAIAVGAAAAITGISNGMFEEAELPVAEYVKSYYRQYRQLPAPNVVHEETGHRLPRTTEPIAFYVDKMYERHMYNEVRDRFGALRDGIRDMNMPSLSETIQDMARVTRQTHRRGTESMNIDEGVQRFLEWSDDTRGLGGITGVVSGWGQYDAVTGGYQKTDLVSMVGRPGMGKTYVALQQASAAFNAGENVLFVTTEMGGMQIARRHVSIAMGVDPDLLKKNLISTRMRERIESFYTDLEGVERFRLFSVGMNASLEALEAFMQEFAPTFVVVDGVYLLKPSSGAKNLNRQEQVRAVYDELKGLAMQADVPMLLTTQFNRQAGRGGADGSLENIGYSDAIATHSSIVAAIKTGPTRNPFHSRYLDLLKGREGESGKFAINFKFAPLDMSEMTAEQLAACEAEESGAEPTATNTDWMV